MSFISDLNRKYGGEITLGGYLKTIREQRKKTQQEIANSIGVQSRNYISEVEKDKKVISLNRVKIICEALNWPEQIAVILWTKDQCHKVGIDFEKIFKKVA